MLKSTDSVCGERGSFIPLQPPRSCFPAEIPARSLLECRLSAPGVPAGQQCRKQPAAAVRGLAWPRCRDQPSVPFVSQDKAWYCCCRGPCRSGAGWRDRSCGQELSGWRRSTGGPSLVHQEGVCTLRQPSLGISFPWCLASWYLLPFGGCGRLIHHPCFFSLR